MGEWFGDQAVTLFDDVALYHVTFIVAGHEEDADGWFDGAKAVNQHRSAHAGHYDICQDEVRVPGRGFKGRKGSLASGGSDNFVATGREEEFGHFQDIGFIINDEQQSFHLRATFLHPIVTPMALSLRPHAKTVWADRHSELFSFV